MATKTTTRAAISFFYQRKTLVTYFRLPSSLGGHEKVNVYGKQQAVSYTTKANRTTWKRKWVIHSPSAHRCSWGHFCLFVRSTVYLHCEKSYLWIPAVYNSLWLKCTEKLRFGGETESAEAKLGNLPSVNSLWICFCIWRSEYSYPTTQIQLQLYGKPRIEMLLTSVLISFFLKGCLAAIVKLLVHWFDAACLQSSLVSRGLFSGGSRIFQTGSQP